MKNSDPVTMDFLEKLPRKRDSVWEMDVRSLTCEIAEDKKAPYHPEALLVVDSKSGFVLGCEPFPPSPPVRKILESLFKLIRKPQDGIEPYLPGKIIVRTTELKYALKPVFEPLGITIARKESLPLIEMIIQDLSEKMGVPPYLYLKSGDLSAGEVKTFFEVTAIYYDLAPWDVVGTDLLFKIECAGLEPKEVFCSVLGSAGLEPGLGVMFSENDVRKFYRGRSPEFMKSCETLALLYSDIEELSRETLEEGTRNKWEIADESAFPLAFRSGRGAKKSSVPDAADLRLLTLCISAVASVVGELEEMPDPVSEDQVHVFEITARYRSNKYELKVTFPHFAEDFLE